MSLVETQIANFITTGEYIDYQATLDSPSTSYRDALASLDEYLWDVLVTLAHEHIAVAHLWPRAACALCLIEHWES